MKRLRRQGAIFLLAVQFLTRLPIPGNPCCTPARLAAMPRYMPAAGGLIGLSVAVVHLGVARIFDPILAALLSTAAGLLLTGCLHEDGFADVCDGLGGGRTRAAALEIMRDSRLGAYGVVGLGVMLALKVLTLGAMPVGVAAMALVAGHTTSRASLVLVIATSHYARSEGAGKPVAGAMRARDLGLALGTGGLALGLLLPVAGPLASAAGFAGLVLGHLAMRARFERRLGGYTGDCLGAVQQMSEIGFYLGVLACL